jgi:hypothetical protein
MWLDVAAIILTGAIGLGFSVLALALQFVHWGGAPMSTIAPAARDYLIRRQMIQYGYRTHPSQKKLNLARDRRVGPSAIGQCLKDQYDALWTPMPRHLAALVEQLETQR